LLRRESAFCALRDVSFVVREGESLGIVGGNGAGKSTLLNLATSLCYPDKGEVKVNGRLTAVLELGSGFHGDLTGAENLFVNAALFGLSRKRTLELFDAIVDFAGVADFINEPLRTYSTGLIMRLAFSVAIHADPDILVIDEVIAVGDQAFSEKCVKRILKFPSRREDCDAGLPFAGAVASDVYSRIVGWIADRSSLKATWTRFCQRIKDDY